ncbi:MAG: hypothetical protein Hyperionvirus7_14 [Hyperionvirus sp.]|uniref:Uncharacterized protein n=1 Tax=Hyperionvirus sp. TaxID=2487770 RepID=A0A3G5AC45_9VIRU|nr:MAG: hypothetical protein Hyperionvirus7_14 [Hyperionvirus sp.]
MKGKTVTVKVRKASRSKQSEEVKNISHEVSRELLDKALPRDKKRGKLSRVYFYKEPNANYNEIDEAYYTQIMRKLAHKPLEFFLGKEIKVGFVVYNPYTGRNLVEWMWLAVLDINPRDNCIVAKLINQSFFVTELKYGDVMCIKRDNVGLVLDPYDVQLFMSVNKYYFASDPNSALNALSDYILSLNLQMM